MESVLHASRRSIRSIVRRTTDGGCAKLQRDTAGAAAGWRSSHSLTIPTGRSGEHVGYAEFRATTLRSPDAQATHSSRRRIVRRISARIPSRMVHRRSIPSVIAATWSRMIRMDASATIQSTRLFARRTPGPTILRPTVVMRRSIAWSSHREETRFQ